MSKSSFHAVRVASILALAGSLYAQIATAQTQVNLAIEQFPRIQVVELVSPMDDTTMDRALAEIEGLAKFERDQQRNAKHVAALINLLELAPAHAPTWFRLGHVFQQMGQSRNALTAFEMARTQGQNKAQWQSVVQKATVNQAVLHLTQLDDLVTKLEAVATSPSAGSELSRAITMIRERSEDAKAKASAAQSTLSARIAPLVEPAQSTPAPKTRRVQDRKSVTVMTGQSRTTS